jgi:hypothetical protein
MASIEDRWFVEHVDANGVKVKVKTDRYGKGRRWKVTTAIRPGSSRRSRSRTKVDADGTCVLDVQMRNDGRAADPSRCPASGTVRHDQPCVARGNPPQNDQVAASQTLAYVRRGVIRDRVEHHGDAYAGQLDHGDSLVVIVVTPVVISAGAVSSMGRRRSASLTRGPPRAARRRARRSQRGRTARGGRP